MQAMNLRIILMPTRQTSGTKSWLKTHIFFIVFQIYTFVPHSNLPVVNTILSDFILMPASGAICPFFFLRVEKVIIIIKYLLFNNVLYNTDFGFLKDTCMRYSCIEMFFEKIIPAMNHISAWIVVVHCQCYLFLFCMLDYP